MTETEIIKIKEVLGNHYSMKIINQLNRLGIFNANGNPFSGGSIRKIVNGNQPNEAIELEILKIVARAEKKKIATAAKRAKLTETQLP
jgi:hypothetical protein